MKPIRIQDQGSTDFVDIDEPKDGDLKPLGEFLASRLMGYWVSKGVPIAQEAFAWSSAAADAIRLGGVVLEARHTSHNGLVVGVAIGMPTGYPGEASRLACHAGSERITEELLRVLRGQCAGKDLVLGEEKPRQWMPL